jgi:hypothetical protein
MKTIVIDFFGNSDHFHPVLSPGQVCLNKKEAKLGLIPQGISHNLAFFFKKVIHNATFPFFDVSNP